MATWQKYTIVFAATLAAGALGTLFPPGQWYRQLEAPPGTPPDAWFAPVWTVLYVAIALATALVWQHSGPSQARVPLLLYAVQLGLNAVSVPLLFAWHAAGWALVDLALLWIAIVGTIVAFRRVPVASLLLVPYLAWVSFAGYLNAGFWWLNR